MIFTGQNGRITGICVSLVLVVRFVIVVLVIFAILLFVMFKLYLSCYFFLQVTVLCIFVCISVIIITWNLLVLFHIATMFSYPKLVWRIGLTRDLSIRVSLLDTIVGVWVWLLCLQKKKIFFLIFGQVALNLCCLY
jgi:hypothetical protein